MRMIGMLLFICGISNAAVSITPGDADLLRHLDQQIEVIQRPGVNDEFFFICQNLRIPCGKETFAGEILIWPSIRKMKIRHETMSARAALDRIVERQPKYRWGVVDGVLILSPRIASKFGPLDKRIHVFRSDSENITSVVSSVAQAAGIEFGITSGIGIGGRSTESSTERKVTLDIKDASVRNILNAAVVADGQAMWALDYQSPTPHGKADTLSVYAY